MAARASALNSLDVVAGCGLGDDGVCARAGPAALPGNIAMCSLSCWRNCVTRRGSARLLAAVEANASLRLLRASEPVPSASWGGDEVECVLAVPLLAQAEALAAART